MGSKTILIGGEWRKTDETFSIYAPYSGEQIAHVCSANANENTEAISHAYNAASEMARLQRFQIAAGLRKIASGIEDRKDEFVRTLALEAAKPIKYAKGEVERGIATFAWAAGEAERFSGEIVPVDTQPGGRNKKAYTIKSPRGVIYGITPFNFPLNLVAHKVAPALASGNSIIIKPSPRTPLTSLLLGEVFLESGLPRASLQIVPMDVKYMNTVIDDDRVGMISFTGSAAVGWELKSKIGKKAIALELGGNAPVIVDESANVDVAMAKTLAGAFAYSGQVCISVQRVYIHENRFEAWTSRFVDEAKNLKEGDPLEASTDISSMIDENAAVRAEAWVNEAIGLGARLLCGGSRRGSMYQPTVLTNTDPEMRVVAEEVFAPVVIVEKFAEFSEAVEMANHSKYGLQAGVFTRDLSNSEFAAQNLKYGGVMINDAPIFRVDNMPYGGMKESGYGREGVRYAMDEMTETKLIIWNT